MQRTALPEFCNGREHAAMDTTILKANIRAKIRLVIVILLYPLHSPDKPE
ncbi:MAG: hypothetical protein JRI32_11170 [Deltaproteobacteria bacterium]|nr:hypothetical protein [Deltaproteobacteria bacterium]